MAPAGQAAPDHEALGHRARRLFDRYIRHRRREPSPRLLYLPGMPTILEIGRWLYWWMLTAGRIERQYGISRWQQLRETWHLTWAERIQAQLYYMYELYLPAEKARIGAYFTRRETKNGLIRALNWVTRQGQGRQTDFGDKAGFVALLGSHSLPTTPILFTRDERSGEPLIAPAEAFECDLFVKDRYGKGAQGATLIRHVGPGQFHYHGQLVSHAQLLADLETRSHRTSIIVVARQFNHPELADLAERSLITFRVFTCLDESGTPAVAWAMMRILGKLEPTWKSKIEWGSAIDLDSGRLGLLVSDMPQTDNGRYTHHPVNDAPVAGRVVPCWAEVCRVATTGHRIAKDRLLIGWDIAVTPNGPVILEANGVPDFVFPQRVHQLPAGETAFGALIALRLEELEREIDRLPPEQRKKSSRK